MVNRMVQIETHWGDGGTESCAASRYDDQENGRQVQRLTSGGQSVNSESSAPRSVHAMAIPGTGLASVNIPGSPYGSLQETVSLLSPA